MLDRAMTACFILAHYYALIIVGVAVVFFGLVHLLRIVYKAQVLIAGKEMPMWISYVAFVISAAFAAWMFAINSW
jgi:hypothetical protein